MCVYMGIFDSLKRHAESEIEQGIWKGVKKTGSQLTKKGRNCTKCKKALPADAAKFCPFCGTSLRNACPKCGKETTPGTTFCSGCGTKI